ncbi:MAG: hypothetical protein GY749_00500 [Desulfobacteraceae bacterium]|nr:hypothetical protein [Desulfobacteraceae bacterium]
MLNFDLMDTVAGQQIYEEGIKDMVIEALKERFVVIPSNIKDSVYSVEDHDALKALLRQAIRSPQIEDFEKVLSKMLSASEQTG